MDSAHSESLRLFQAWGAVFLAPAGPKGFSPRPVRGYRLERGRPNLDESLVEFCSR